MDRRRLKIFKESFQLKIVRTLVFVSIFSLVIFAMLGYMILFWSSAAEELGLARSATSLFLNLAKVFLVVTLILMGLVFWISYLISRNLLGPLKRLRDSIEKLIKTKNPKILRFRKSDELEFHYISEAFNELVDRQTYLNQKVTEIEKDIANFLKENEKGMIKRKGIIPFVEEIRTRVISLNKTI